MAAATSSFDVLAAVLFDSVYGIVQAVLIPADLLQENVWDAPQVPDATARLRAIL